MRYAAFISYNHRDRAAANWLLRAIETYRIPARLRGRESPVGTLGARLPPVFQDREELAASSDLAESVRAALEQSASLIVICSPNGAKSHWVNEEIRAFAAMGHRDRIQCLIVDGEPNASHVAGADPDRECLPPALFENGGAEPLAADIRPGQDGRSAARLKLIAGIIGVGYDELRQREQARRQKRLAVLASASAIGFVFMSGLAIFAVISRNEAIEQRNIARQKTETAERTVDFVKSMFEVADPSEARGTTITAREVVDRGAERIAHELSTEPSVKADIGTTLAEVYTGLGLLSQSERMIQQMLSIPGVDPGTRARQYLALGEVRTWQANDRGALEAFAKALALARDPRSGRSDLISHILSGMGLSQASQGDDGAAMRNIRSALAMDRQRGASATLDVARDLEALGYADFYAGRFDKARASFQQALAIRTQRQGRFDPHAIQDLNQLGSVAYMQHDNAAAERYFGALLPLQEHVLGPRHPAVGTSLNNLSRVLIERRNYAAAIPLLERAAQIELAQRGPGSPDFAFIYGNLGIALRARGEDATARNYLEKARAIASANKHRNLAPILVDLADQACDRAEPRRGLRLLEEAGPVMQSTYKDDPWRMAWLHVISARCLLADGQRQKAARLFATAADTVLQRWPVASHYGERTRRIGRLVGR